MKSLLKKAIIIAAVTAMLVSSAGCGDLEAERDVFAMDTFMSFRVYGENAESSADAIAVLVQRLDGLFSVTSENSELSRVNMGGTVSVSEETFSVIKDSLALSEALGSCFELSLYPVSRAWGFTGEENRVPSDAELSELLLLVDDSRVILDEENLTVTLPAGFMLDLGAVLKGCAADRARRILSENNEESALLNFGSSTILAYGKKTDGSCWRVGVKSPDNDGSYIGVIEAEDVFISTSGGYERCFTDEDGNVYHHIIDPETGKPASGSLASVTVITDNGMYGDALSTALFVMGEERAEEYWRSHRDFEYIFVLKDGSVIVSEGAQNLFTPK